MQHRYSVGQMLDLTANPRLSNRPSGLCEVLALLPHDKGPVLYRVKCRSETNERVVEETDLSATNAVADTHATPIAAPSIVIARR